ncbi:c-type cytochrome [Gluconacetobacter sacchari]|uniref:Cytochrome c n=2 Tax=Gluconacetobacter sacchari TaxID=92759 RepID=A0A7W4IFT7_9PROT|nr:cytochrome c [Gluconacetobacter sacchari]MBB2162095.1 cytochrome c [Gluconacetobacter sacchari]GBQ29309.1 sorbitol dehydrogenase cytochrome c subunit [Gluconacetobacter sacchari DSM 12717]
MRRWSGKGLGLAGRVGLAAVALLLSRAVVHAQSVDANEPIAERGRYLAVAADCAACHTAPGGGKPFAGGYGIASPLGAIYSTNITPSRDFGIGTYSEAQFGRALREGIRGDGAHLYPAMPYTSYTKLTDADVHALYVYFMTDVKPVEAPARRTVLPFPYNIRATMAVWNALFLDDRRFEPESGKSVAVNRGHYLAYALAHCDTCHTPRNVMMAEMGGRALGGASLSSWYAPNITSDPKSGLGGWSDDDLARYLKTGDVPGKAQAGGPMAEAVEHSLQYLNDDDIRAIVAYIKQVPAIADAADKAPRDTYGKPSDREAAYRGLDARALVRGERLFTGECAACHRPTGTGSPDGYYPQLFHNTAVGAARPDNLISTILMGVRREVGGHTVYMPGFGSGSYVDSLSDQDIADISTYVEQQFGNPAVRVSAEEVTLIRTGGPKPLIARLGAFAVPGMIAGVLMLAGAALLVLRRVGKKP